MTMTMTARFPVSAFKTIWTGVNHPESIVWDGDRNLLYAGGERGEIYRGDLDNNWQQIADCGTDAFVLGLALDARGDLYVCERGNSRLLRIDSESLEQVELSRGTPSRPMICPNFAAFDVSGRLLVTDSGTWGADDGVVFTLSSHGETSVWSTVPSNFPNGIAFSQDGAFLYVVESAASKVWRIEVREDGSAGACKLVWHVPDTVPDGVTLDAAGDLYISCYTPDSIYVVDMATGESELLLHDWSGQHMQAPTNIAFVGPELDQLASANLCGRHVNVATGLGITGLPLVRPEVER